MSDLIERLGRELLRPKRILVVDDEEALHSAVGPLIESEGGEYTGARSGEEALKLLSKQAFDIVFLDVKMPGMDGIMTARIMRQKDRRFPKIVFITGYLELAAQGNMGLIPGPVVVAPKPQTVEEWRELIIDYGTRRIYDAA